MAGTSAERPNIRQVAEIAGVSHMTVSRVMNDYPHIKEATRKRVLDVIDELGYRPNQAARALATQRTRRIGVLVESAASYGPTSILRALEFAARTSGYSVDSIALHGGDEVTPQDAIEHLTGQGIDALCIVAPRSSSLATIRKIAIAVPVLVVKPDKDPTFLTISIDQHAGAALAVDHLVSLGHRDVLHLAGPLDWLDARARERAFHARAKEWGMRERPIVVGDWSADFAYDYARGLRGLPDYTGVFVANDDMAIGLIHGFHERGISVPDDISVVGFDGVSLAAHALPPLTTVQQNFASLGAAAVDMLRAAIERRDIPNVTRIQPELVVRSSTSAPRGGR
ncbi:LacI family DNA-binding transcriptional regulator [Microbacterium halophytorum]|uniref:LacI family DNA-binding transcriptional regulator n=1 Tax=Microbacterium halophytorum TaxID=2067568 RepID=UPI000CFE2996|nr:LacI family DNA-binding transcriptional regulator [Microbacterium halophytorum]